MVFEKIKSLIADQLMIAESEITLESEFIKDLNADSLDLVQMLSGIVVTF